MSATVLHMSISLDGFVAGPNEGPDNPTGDGGYRLHSWFLTSTAGDDFKKVSMGGVMGEAYAELMTTGAVVAGRGTFKSARAGMGTTTTAYRSSSTAAKSPASTSASGRWSPTSTTSRVR